MFPIYLELRKLLGQNLEKSPNGGLMVIHHGKKMKNHLKQTKINKGVLNMYN